MAKKTPTSDNQLSLFDAGMNAPTSEPAPVPKKKRKEPVPASSPIVEYMEPVRAAQPEGVEATAFQKDVYDYYKVLWGRAMRVGTYATIVTLIAIGMAIYGIKIQTVPTMGGVGIKLPPHHVATGFVSIAALFLLTGTLFTWLYAMQKKRQCGLYYQRVMSSVSDPLSARGSNTVSFIVIGLVIFGIVLVTAACRHPIIYALRFFVWKTLSIPDWGAPEVY